MNAFESCLAINSMKKVHHFWKSSVHLSYIRDKRIEENIVKELQK